GSAGCRRRASQPLRCQMHRGDPSQPKRTRLRCYCRRPRLRGVRGHPHGEADGRRESMSGPIFRKVDPRVWDDDKFIELSDDAKLLWLLILTGPQTSYVPGLMTTGIGTLAEVLRKGSRSEERRVGKGC